jgi:hypothetical protein
MYACILFLSVVNQKCILIYMVMDVCLYTFHVAVIAFRSFPREWLVTGFATRVTRRVPLVRQELLSVTEHPSSPRILVGFVLLDSFHDNWIFSGKTDINRYKEFEDTKGVSRICKSKKNRQHNDHKKKGQNCILFTFFENDSFFPYFLIFNSNSTLKCSYMLMVGITQIFFITNYLLHNMGIWI